MSVSATEYKAGYKAGLAGEFAWTTPFKKRRRVKLWTDGYLDGLVARVRAADLRCDQAAVHIPLIAQPAIYFLYKARQVMYVGQSQNVVARLAAHLQRGAFDELVFIPTPLDKLNSEERRFISLFDPPLNKSRGLQVECCPYKTRRQNP